MNTTENLNTTYNTNKSSTAASGMASNTQQSHTGAKSASPSTLNKKPTADSTKEGKEGAEDFRIEDTLETVKGYAQTAAGFIKKRPVAILLGAVAVGAIAGAIALSVKAASTAVDKASA